MDLKWPNTSWQNDKNITHWDVLKTQGFIENEYWVRRERLYQVGVTGAHDTKKAT